MYGQQAFGMNHAMSLINPYSYNRPLQSLSPDGHRNNNFSYSAINNNNYNIHANSPPKDNNYLFNSNFNINKEPEQQIPHQVSFARNFKGRLFNADPNAEKQKQKQKNSYRQELQRQVKQVQQRKRKQKEKIQAQDLKFQREFMQQQQIYAKRDGKDKKQQPSYFVVRSSQKNRKKVPIVQKNIQKQKGPSAKVDNYLEVDDFHDKPKILKRAYKIATQNTQLKNNPEQQQLEKIKEKNFQQERISKIMLFQQNMLKKLDNLRNDIRQSGHHLHVHKQLEGIRLKIRAKPLVLPGIDRQTHFHDFYNISSMKKPQNKKSQMYRISQSFDLSGLKKPLNNSRANQSVLNNNSSINSQKSRAIIQRQSQNEQINDKNYYGSNQEELDQVHITEPRLISRKQTPKLKESRFQNQGGFGTDDNELQSQLQ